MDSTTAYKMLGERAQQLAGTHEVQKKMVEMVNNGKTKEEVESWLYICAIGTLMFAEQERKKEKGK